MSLIPDDERRDVDLGRTMTGGGEPFAVHIEKLNVLVVGGYSFDPHVQPKAAAALAKAINAAAESWAAEKVAKAVEEAEREHKKKAGWIIAGVLGRYKAAVKKEAQDAVWEDAAKIADQKAIEETNLMENTCGEMGDPSGIGMAEKIASAIRSKKAGA